MFSYCVVTSSVLCIFVWTEVFNRDRPSASLLVGEDEEGQPTTHRMGIGSAAVLFLDSASSWQLDQECGWTLQGGTDSEWTNGSDYTEQHQPLR